MPATFIETAISSTGADTLTDIFLGVIFICFVVAIICKILDKLPAFTTYTPTLLTSLGILGTFMGIVAGLLSFDTAHIDQSISPLLEGLKTAFITSLAGMLSSIIYKLLVATGIFSRKTQDNGPSTDDVTAADLYSVMQEQQQGIARLCKTICNNDTDISQLYKTLEQQAEGIENLQKAIGGNNDSSLVGQFKLMRSDMNDNNRSQDKHQQQLSETLSAIGNTLSSTHTVTQSQQEAFKGFEASLWIKLQDFADMLSKSATEQVIEALKSVIEDFNNNLTEQFGENFKQLNLAVHELVDWQNNYKQQLAEMKGQYDHSVKAISQTESSVAHISEKTQAIPEAMDSLTKVMEVNQQQINELSQHLDAFKGIRDKAVDALPEIRQQIDATVNGAKQASEEMAKGVQESTSNLKTTINSSANNYRETVEKARSSLDEAATVTASASTEVKKQLTTALTEMDLNLKNLIETLLNNSKTLNTQYAETGKTLVDGLEKNGKTVNQNIADAGTQMVKSLEKGSKDIGTAYKKAGEQLVADIRSGGEAFNEGYKQASSLLMKETDKTSQTFQQSVKDMQSSLSKAIKDQTIHQANEMDKMLARLDKTLEKIFTDSTQSMDKKIKTIDQTMETEIDNVMKSMGGALTSISGQFTKDYTQLTQQMQKVTQQSREFA
ncbi:Chromosome partition protein Smc [invertebrate metagenome]|uniref:Chromosome partition protein Smc n=1 Tax=invertebrate metagenome TaxID=1711999 RepID=A0A2H9T8J7_9ZZZZ